MRLDAMSHPAVSEDERRMREWMAVNFDPFPSPAMAEESCAINFPSSSFIPESQILSCRTPVPFRTLRIGMSTYIVLIIGRDLT